WRELLYETPICEQLPQRRTGPPGAAVRQFSIADTLWPRDAIPVAQKTQQLRREHRVAILAAFAALDARHHPFGIDIRYLQRDDLGDAPFARSHVGSSMRA